MDPRGPEKPLIATAAFFTVVFDSHRGRSAWAVPPLLFAGVVLVAGLAFNLANLDTGPETVPDVPDAGGTAPTSTSLIDLLPFLYAAMATLAVLFLVAFFLLLRTRRRKGPAAHVLRRSMAIQTLVTLLIFFLLLAIWRQGNPGGGSDGDPPPDPNAANPGFPVPNLPRIAGIPLVVFLAASLFIALAFVVYALRGGQAGHVAAPAGVQSGARQAAVAALGETIRRLEFGGDVRGAILLCFHRFCELLGARGVSGQDVLTPRELEGLAVRQLRVSGDAAEDLTGLFEEARYSEHVLDEDDRQRAVRSLERLRAVLEA